MRVVHLSSTPMTTEVDRWQKLGAVLGIEVTAPATIVLGSQHATFTAFLPQVGGRSGMVVDPDWKAIGPYAEVLTALGYGFSAVTLGSDADDEDAKDMSRDWGWSADGPTPVWW